MICYKLVSKQENGMYSMITKGKYRLSYQLDKETSMVKNTVGLFCWETKKALYHSLKYTISFQMFRVTHNILEVEGINRIRKPKIISDYVYEKGLNNFYRGDYCLDSDVSELISEDWIFFKKVKPLKVSSI